jgi:hypothetical protein
MIPINFWVTTTRHNDSHSRLAYLHIIQSNLALLQTRPYIKVAKREGGEY